jgi:aryl-alcohol dehydrogenase-like predicted oxidoreductase
VRIDEINAAASGTWTLGDMTVNRIGFGAKRLAGAGRFDIDTASDRDRVVALLRRAVDLGVNHIDTAAFYPSHPAPQRGPTGFASLGWANRLIRSALAPYPEDLVIATKVGPTDAGMARPDQFRGLVEENLRDLGRDHLDMVYLRQHGLDSIADHLGALADLRDEGLVRHLGLSNVRPEHLAQAREVAPVVAVQNRYGVDFGRVNDGLLRCCGDDGIAFVPFFALAASGREAGGVAANEMVRAIAARHKATPAQVRIAWTLGRGHHVLAIPGTGDPGHLTENVAAGALRLSAEELAGLSSLRDEAEAGSDAVPHGS